MSVVRAVGEAGMRSLPKKSGNKSKQRALLVLLTVGTIGACAQRSSKMTPVTSSAPPPVQAPEPVASVQPPPPPVFSGPLRLNEMRLIETAGQRSMLFRFSRPPEGVDYFPLRNPSRLVIDVKGPIDSVLKIHTYKASDSLVSSVRVGAYQGRLRLVIDLKAAAVPQFSVDNYETLLTAFMGEKDINKSSAQSNAQVLFVSEEGRNNYAAEAASASEKLAVNKTKTAMPASLPAPASMNGVEKTNSVIAAEALSEEKLPATVPPTTPAEEKLPATAPSTTPAVVETAAPSSAMMPPEKPIEIAQVSPSPAPSPERSPETVNRGKVRRKRTGEETLPPPASEPLISGPSGEFRPVSANEYTGRKISLDFKNADIHDVFRILADVSGLNIVATDDVKARVTLRLVEVPWDQALDVVLQANGLEQTQIGNVLTISTTKRLEAERNARLLAQNAQQKIAPLETVYVRINYVKATDVVSIITREIEQRASAVGPGGGAGGPMAPTPVSTGAGSQKTQVALMSPRGTIAADPTTNVVIIRDVIDRIAAVRELIQNVDVQTPQVVIESYLITTNENLNRDLGIQWGYSYTASPATGNPTGVNFPGTINASGSGLTTGSGGVPFIADFPAAVSAGAGSAIELVLGSLDGSQSLDARLTALESQGKARVISRPRVVTLNNKIAQIKSRRTVRVPIISGSLNVGGAGSTQGGGNAFQEFDVGITLKITPQISSDGFVLLDVDAESSELTDASVRPSGSSSFFPIIPDTLLRTASSNVLIRAGQTFVLGGILADNMRQSEKGIPYLKDAPGIGWLFRENLRSRVKDELLVFITPKLVPGITTTGLPTAQQLWENRPKEVELGAANRP